MPAKKPTTQTSGEKVTGPASYFPSIERTYGRPISEWKDLIHASPLTRHMDLVNWLKTEHGVGHGHANALVGHTLAEQAAQREKAQREKAQREKAQRKKS